MRKTIGLDISDFYVPIHTTEHPSDALAASTPHDNTNTGQGNTEAMRTTVIDLCSPDMLDALFGMSLCSHPDDEMFRKGYDWVFNSIPEFDEDAYLNVCHRAGVNPLNIVGRIEKRNPDIHQRYRNLLDKQNPRRGAFSGHNLSIPVTQFPGRVCQLAHRQSKGREAE